MCKKIISNMFCYAVLAGLAWFALSYFEILCKRMFGGATFSDYNIIVNLINYCMDITGGVF